METCQGLWEPSEGEPHPFLGIREGFLKEVISKLNFRASGISQGNGEGCSRQKTRHSQRPRGRMGLRHGETCRISEWLRRRARGTCPAAPQQGPEWRPCWAGGGPGPCAEEERTPPVPPARQLHGRRESFLVCVLTHAALSALEALPSLLPQVWAGAYTVQRG